MKKEVALMYLKIGLIICLGWVGVRATQFAINHIPPYNEGQCLKAINPELANITAKIEHNNVLKAESTVGVIYAGIRFDQLTVPFEEQRESYDKFEKVPCP